MILWAITDNRYTVPVGGTERKVVICQGRDREEAKRAASRYLGGNPDIYVCEPLTKPTDIVHVELRLT